MSASLGRPVIPTDDAEGSSLGSAVLAMLATGQVTLASGLARLGISGGAESPVEVSSEDVATYSALRSRTGDPLTAHGGLQEFLYTLHDSR